MIFSKGRVLGLFVAADELAVMLSLLVAANGLVMSPPPQVAIVQQVVVQQLGMQQLSVERAAIFPTTNTIAAVLERTGAKPGKPPIMGEIDGVPKGQVVKNKCPTLDEMIEMKSAGKTISKSCSAQAAQAKVLAKQKRAAAQAAYEKQQIKEEEAAARAAAGPPGLEILGVKLI